MIEVSDLVKQYRDLVAVDHISFKVGKGEIVGFLGLNGAGKSTTMKVLTGFIPATLGAARVAGFDVFDQPMEVKRSIGYLPEVLPLYPELTVREFLEFVGSIKGLRGKARSAEIERVLSRAELTDVADRLTGNLSKGYQQRCGIAQALLGNPPVLILDEPTSGLDPRQRQHVLDFIKSLQGDHTIVLSTHILSEVEIICPRAIIIHHGKIAADDSIENLIKAHSKPGHTASFGEVFNIITDDLGRNHAAVGAAA